MGYYYYAIDRTFLSLMTSAQPSLLTSFLKVVFKTSIDSREIYIEIRVND